MEAPKASIHASFFPSKRPPHNFAIFSPQKKITAEAAASAVHT